MNDENMPGVGEDLKDDTKAVLAHWGLKAERLP